MDRQKHLIGVYSFFFLFEEFYESKRRIFSKNFLRKIGQQKSTTFFMNVITKCLLMTVEYFITMHFAHGLITVNTL